MKTRTLQGDQAMRIAVSPIKNVQVRGMNGGTGDGSWTIEGYAAVTEQETTLFDLSWIRVREEIARGAFRTVLSRLASGDGLVHFNFGHDMNTSVASTAVDASQIGHLELEEDFHGLRFFARVDSSDPDAQRLAVKMQRGVVNQASFAFTVAEEELAEEDVIDTAQGGKWDELWRVNEIQDLFDVCACPQGAYPQTEAYVRTLAAGSLARSGFQVPDLGRFKRADVAALDLLVDAYEAVQEFIAIEDQPDDADDRAQAQEILDALDGLIQVEAVEPDDGAMAPEMNGRTKVGRQRRRGKRGVDHAAPSQVGEGDQQAALIRSRVDATYQTLTRKAAA